MSNIFKTAPIVLSESNETASIKKMQVLRTGDFYHDRYGNFQITTKMLSDMVDNFKKGVRGVKPALDYSHDSEGVAAGWFQDLFIQNGGTELWANIEMTPKGNKVLAEKEFGYISAEFDPSYETNETPTQKVGAVLLGAGLTNRPVIKKMQSVIELSEGGKMDIKELEEKLMGAEKKLSDYEEMQKKLMEDMGAESMEQVMELIASMNGKNKELGDKAEEKEKEMLEVKKELSEAKESLKLAEQKVILAEKESKFTVMLSEGKACAAQKDAYLKGDMEEFVKNSQAMNLSESGHGNTPKDDGKSPEDKILELARKMTSENTKMELSEAISKVRKENPELVKKLQEKK